MVNNVHSNVSSIKEKVVDSRPRTPSLNVNSLSLTEYSTNPSPPSSTPKPNVGSIVPEDFMLPNGYPDVCLINCSKTEAYKSSTSDLSSPPAFTKLSKKPL